MCASNSSRSCASARIVGSRQTLACSAQLPSAQPFSVGKRSQELIAMAAHAVTINDKIRAGRNAHGVIFWLSQPRARERKGFGPTANQGVRRELLNWAR